MKRTALITGLLSGIVPVLFAQDPAPVRHSLVVTVGNYPPESGFRRINAGNDRMVISGLMRRQGFTDTVVLNDESATKEGFTRCFGELCSRVQPGDIVCLHFSTHGQQIEDADGDEPDGLDEAIALYDAKSRCTDDYRGQNHLTDDELGRMLGKLRGNLGEKGDILVTIDACHSGSMTRGQDTTILRGGYPPLHSRQGNGGEEKIRRDSRHELFGPEIGGKGANLANVVILSACENDEVSSEYYHNRRFFGPLTWALLNALVNNTREDYTYAKLYHDISSEMNGMFQDYATRQHPTMETSGGDVADRVILGGRPVGQKPYFPVEGFISPDTIQIGGGTLTGLSDGTSVNVCPSGTIDPAEAKTGCIGGIVIRAGFLESVVRLDAPLDKTTAADQWAFVADRKLGDFSVSVALGSFTDAGLKKKATTLVTGSGFAMITTVNPMYMLEQKAGTARMVLRHARSRKVFRNPVDMGELESTLLAAARMQFLKQLQSSAPGMAMEISLTSAGRTSGIEPSRAARLDRVQAGIDTAWLTITNNGTREFCFNVLEIDPDDRLSVILPSDEVSGQECCLRPGMTFRKRYLFSEPCGTEMLKVLASGKRFDLRNALNENQATRSVAGELERLFSPTVAMRGETTLPASESLVTGSIYFEIINNK